MHESDKPRLNIRAIREERGYTQEYMAEMLNICQSTYANLESGKTALSISRLIKIADVLNADLMDLVDIGDKNKTISAVGRLPSPEESHTTVETTLLYEQLIKELRSEVDFLRTIIKNKWTSV